eukprot:m.1318237 g.1318237  ORF g.1318237 m.1318237 type:complete len:446 (+) comp24841_c0_seq20:2658-3995(+)
MTATTMQVVLLAMTTVMPATTTTRPDFRLRHRHTDDSARRTRTLVAKQQERGHHRRPVRTTTTSMRCWTQCDACWRRRHPRSASSCCGRRRRWRQTHCGCRGRCGACGCAAPTAMWASGSCASTTRAHTTSSSASRQRASRSRVPCAGGVGRMIFQEFHTWMPCAQAVDVVHVVRLSQGPLGGSACCASREWNTRDIACVKEAVSMHGMCDHAWVSEQVVHALCCMPILTSACLGVSNLCCSAVCPCSCMCRCACVCVLWCARSTSGIFSWRTTWGWTHSCACTAWCRRGTTPTMTTTTTTPLTSVAAVGGAPHRSLRATSDVPRSMLCLWRRANSSAFQCVQLAWLCASAVVGMRMVPAPGSQRDNTPPPRDDKGDESSNATANAHASGSGQQRTNVTPHNCSHGKSRSGNTRDTNDGAASDGSDGATVTAVIYRTSGRERQHQ